MELKSKSIFDKIYDSKSENEKGVKTISYDEFMKIKNTSTEEVNILDARSSEDYAKGHIMGAISFPYNNAKKEKLEEQFPNDAKLIVYCGSFECPLSTKAAAKISSYNYEILDYEGGIADWVNHGHILQSS